MPNYHSKRSLVLFSKAPVPGKVKTRLAAHISNKKAALLQEAFIADTLATLKTIENVDLFVACHPGSSHPFFLNLAAKFNLHLLDQCGAGLGDRIKHVLGRLKKYEQVVIIGSDSPTLGADKIRAAFEKLDKHRLVIGPSLDGGYYLIGLSGQIPPLFDGVNWGSETVFKETMDMAERAGLSTAVLDSWYDVDTINELRYLSIHLESLPQNRCLKTRGILKKLKEELRLI